MNRVTAIVQFPHPGAEHVPKGDWTRTAVHARDRGCTHPSCDEPLDRCQVDHVIPWSRGGLTTQANGQDKCRFHNHHKGDRPPRPAA